MTIWAVIWVVLMILWLLDNGYALTRPVAADGPAIATATYGGNILPFLCVLILGLIVLGAVGGPAVVTEHVR